MASVPVAHRSTLGVVGIEKGIQLEKTLPNQTGAGHTLPAYQPNQTVQNMDNMFDDDDYL